MSSLDPNSFRLTTENANTKLTNLYILIYFLTRVSHRIATHNSVYHQSQFLVQFLNQQPISYSTQIHNLKLAEGNGGGLEVVVRNRNIHILHAGSSSSLLGLSRQNNLGAPLEPLTISISFKAAPAPWDLTPKALKTASLADQVPVKLALG